MVILHVYALNWGAIAGSSLSLLTGSEDELRTAGAHRQSGAHLERVHLTCRAISPLEDLPAPGIGVSPKTLASGVPVG